MEKLGEYSTISIEVDNKICSVLPTNVSMDVFHEVYEELSHSIHLQYEPELDCVLFVMGESEGGKNNGV